MASGEDELMRLEELNELMFNANTGSTDLFK